MAALTSRFSQVILCFAGLFYQRTWQHAQLLLMGALLVPGARTAASVLRVLGLASDGHFVNFHRVLSRAAWSPRAAARVLLGMLVRAFVPDGPIVLGIDDTIEHRRGAAYHRTRHLPRPGALVSQSLRQGARWVDCAGSA